MASDRAESGRPSAVLLDLRALRLTEAEERVSAVLRILDPTIELIHIDRTEQGTQAALFDEAELQSTTRQSIEIR